MSLPFYGITCSGCDYQDGYSFGIRYEYEGIPDHRPPLGIAWCKGCNKVVTICKPFTPEHAQDEIADLESQFSGNKTGLFARFSASKKENIEEAQQQIQAVNRRLAYFQATPYPNRCLFCGSHDVFPFTLPDGDYGEVEGLNIKHTCGGQLRISMNGRFAFIHHPKVVFDEAGVIIHDERKQNS